MSMQASHPCCQFRNHRLLDQHHVGRANEYLQIFAIKAENRYFVEKIWVDFSNQIAATLILAFRQNEYAFALPITSMRLPWKVSRCSIFEIVR